MRQRIGLIIPVCLALCGCGPGGGVVEPGDPTVRDALTEFQVALTDAQGTLQSAMAPRNQPQDTGDGESGDDEDRPEDQIRSVLQLVKSSAENVARIAAGQPTEPQAKALLADADELLKKSQGAINAAEIKQALEQLATKAQAMAK